MGTVVISIVIALITAILAWAIRYVMTWCIGTYQGMFFNAMAVETLFSDVVGSNIGRKCKI